MRVGDLDIDIPASWEDHSLYSFVAPPEVASPKLALKQAPFRKNVVLQRRPLPDEATLLDCVAHVQQTTARDFGEGVQVTVEDGPVCPGGPTKRLTYKLVDPATSQPVVQVVYVARIRGAEWQIAFSAQAASLRDVLPQFDAVVASIRAA